LVLKFGELILIRDDGFCPKAGTTAIDEFGARGQESSRTCGVKETACNPGGFPAMKPAVRQ